MFVFNNPRNLLIHINQKIAKQKIGIDFDAAKIARDCADLWHCQDSCLQLIEKTKNNIRQSKNYVFLPSNSEIT